MEATELRIGNLFQVGKYTQIIEVLELTFDRTNGFYINKHIRADDAKGIPLTDEWLKDFGFTITGNGANIVYNEFGNIVILNRVEGLYESTYLRTPILYVHQLQNYYHAVVGKELTQSIKTL